MLLRFARSLPLLVVFVTVGCAYRLGSVDRSLPSGYRQVAIPIFKNLTQEVGIEVAFTNALRQEFQRSKAGEVVPSGQDEVLLEGVIETAKYEPGGKREGGNLPRGVVLASEYRILVNTRIRLLRSTDRSILWEGTFSGERTYVAPQVTQAGLNTVNPLYNLSSRRQNIEIMALNMMSEAHDRMTENF